MISDKTYLLKKEDKLFEAALNEFSMKSYDMASINDIIKNAGYNKGSLYYRFKTKSELYHALIDYVFTAQTAILNASGTRIKEIEKAEDIYRFAFNNLIALNSVDSRYCALLRQIDMESDLVRADIKNNCITSLFQRFIDRLREVAGEQVSPEELKIEFLMFRKLYHDFPFKMAENNAFVELMIRKIHPNTTSGFYSHATAQPLSIADITNNPSLILADEVHQVQIPFASLTSLINDKEFPIQIKERLKLRKLDLRGVIAQGITRNLRDFSHLTRLYDLDFGDHSFHTLSNMEKAILASVYLTLIGNETIVFDFLMDSRKPKLIQLFFAEILPLLAKTSKIVLIDREFPVSNGNWENIYLYENNTGLKAVGNQMFEKLLSDTFQITYTNNEGYLVTRKIKSGNFNFEEFRDKQFLQISRTVKVERKDLAGLE